MLASVVIKIEYHRALQQGLDQAPRWPLIPALPAPNKPPISSAPPAFLTGSGLQTEMAVTHSKQTTGTFLTGSRIACSRSDCCAGFAHFRRPVRTLFASSAPAMRMPPRALQILHNPHRLA